ncbi:hypothetical protein VTO73DRAFT_1349 [Trametes versicolor]
MSCPAITLVWSTPVSCPGESIGYAIRARLEQRGVTRLVLPTQSRLWVLKSGTRNASREVALVTGHWSRDRDQLPSRDSRECILAAWRLAALRGSATVTGANSYGALHMGQNDLEAPSESYPYYSGIYSQAATKGALFSACQRISKGFVILQRPKPPAEDKCCMSGCVIRVYDLYDEALQDYVQALGKLHANLDKMGVPEDQWPADIRRTPDSPQPAKRADVVLSAFEQFEKALKEKNLQPVQQEPMGGGGGGGGENSARSKAAAAAIIRRRPPKRKPGLNKLTPDNPLEAFSPLWTNPGLSQGSHNTSPFFYSAAYTPVQPPPPRGKTRLASAFFAYFVLGWGDGVTGTLLPHFKSDLHLSFLLSSLFWVASASGYALGTVIVEHITRILGRTRFLNGSVSSAIGFPWPSREPSKKIQSSTIGFSRSRSRFHTLVLASVLHAVFFAIMGSERGFASMMIAYVISAFARSFVAGAHRRSGHPTHRAVLTLAPPRNVYVPFVAKGGLGFLYGFNSVGSFVAPLVCQSIIATGIRWANFYFGSLVLSALNTSFIIYAFWPTQSELKGDAELASQLYRTAVAASDVASSFVAATPERSPTSSTAPIVRKKEALGPRSYTVALKNLQMWAAAVFACIYSGSESATQGFIVVYLLGTRHANPNTVGYVTSGFWGGMAISRFVWGYLGNIITFRQRKWIVQACM